MIKLKLREAIEASKALANLPRIRAKAAYDLARIRDKIKPELRAFDETERALIEEHGGKIKEDRRSIAWPVPKEGETPADVAFQKDREELLDKEIEIGREPVKLADLLGPDESKHPDIEPELLSMLEKIIVE